MTCNDQQLLDGLRKHDPQALSTAFDCFSDRIYRLAVSLLQDEQQADGVVQDSFITLIEHIDRFEGRAAISTWLYRVAYNNCMGRLRKKRPTVEIDAHDDPDILMPTQLLDWRTLPEAVISADETQDQITQAVEQLSPALRAVFLMRDVEDFSTEETAAALGISLSAVKVRLHRARLQLREALASYFAHETSNEG